MQGVVARRNHFTEPILDTLREAYDAFGRLTGRYYGLLTQYKTADADTVFVSLGSAAENIEAGVDYLRQKSGATVGSIHLNVIRPFPEAAVVAALAGKKNVIVLERTDEAMAGDNPMGRDIRTALNKALVTPGNPAADGLPISTVSRPPGPPHRRTDTGAPGACLRALVNPSCTTRTTVRCACGRSAAACLASRSSRKSITCPASLASRTRPARSAIRGCGGTESPRSRS